MLETATRCLQAQASRIDALNVFPVPDGDTGTNMLLTMRAALRAASRDGSVSAVADAAARGALLGARGNSGVILSQFLVGMAQAVKGAAGIGPAELGRAFRHGSALAYKAVSQPVEGTMLTVLRETSEAVRPFEAEGDLPAFLEAALAAAGAALARTPDLLPVLREAGVVDAGGQGLYTLLEGMCLYTRGDLQFVQARPEPSRPGPTAEVAPTSGFCVEFTLSRRKHSLERVTRELGKLGTSLIVAGVPGLVRVHLHSDEPDALIRRAASLGSLEQLQVRDMKRQQYAFQHRRDEPNAVIAPDVVAVVPGAGLARVCLGLGAAVVVVGVRSPSAEELLEAIESAPAARVFVLPNDKNIILAAEQARTLGSKEVSVIPATNIAQGIAALVAFRPEQTADANLRSMQEAMSAVHALEVCQAVRTTRLNGVAVRKNQLAAYLDGELVAAAASAGKAIREALAHLPMEKAQNLALYYGAGVRAGQAARLADSLRADYPRLEVEAISGGQPVQAYLIGVE